MEELSKKMFNKSDYSEQPEYERKYVLNAVAEPISETIFVIDSEEYCTMLLADEY